METSLLSIGIYIMYDFTMHNHIFFNIKAAHVLD